MTTSKFAAASMLLALTAAPAAAIQGGFQSGPSKGSFYSGGMNFEPTINRAFLTGSHYNLEITPHDNSKNAAMGGSTADTASSCYVGKIDFDKAVDGDDTFTSLTDWVSYGNPGKIETCSGVVSTKGSDVYVVGSVADGGLFSDGYPMQGLLSILDTETLGFIDATLIKSAQDPSTHMIYPLDVIHDSGRKFIYIAALTSTDAKVNEITGTNKDQPNWQEQHMLGSGFDVTVIKIHAPVGEKPSAVWVKHFPLDTDANGETPPVFVAGMALQRDTNDVQHLLLAGSTRGSGEAFGKVAPNSVDADGFVMQLALKDGSFIKHDRHKGQVYNYIDNLREGTASDDFIRGMCSINKTGPNNKSDEFFVVGGTKGDMTTDDQGKQNVGGNAGYQFGAGVEKKYSDSWNREESLQPFLRKVGITDLKPVWTTQWAAMPMKTKTSGAKFPTNAYAMDCWVHHKEAVYVVGSVMNGDKMVQGNVEMINQGGDDVWVAKVDIETGNVFWLTQLGSPDDEKLARHGSIAVNNEGNVIIYGDTNGSLYRPRGGDEDPNVSDTFLMTLDAKTGAVLDKFYLGGTSSASVASSINGVPPVVSAPQAPAPDDVPPAASDSDDVASKPVTNDSNKDVNKESSVKKEKSNTAGVVFAVLFAIAAVLAASYFLMTRQMKKRKAESQKASIFSCLQQFDVEDIDLRRSPPGGWHGTYMNKLAYGHNNADDIPVESPTKGEGAPLTHSSVANDALFMDDAAASSGTGYRDDAGKFSIDDSDDVDVRLDNKIV